MGSWIACIWSGSYLLAVSSLEIATGSQEAQGAKDEISYFDERIWEIIAF